jgi:hypothetical protein
LITGPTLEAFLQCPLKAHYLLSGRTPPKTEYDEFNERLERIHVDKVRLALGSILSTEASSAVPLVHEDLSTHPDALERVGKSAVVVPVRIFPRALPRSRAGRLARVSRAGAVGPPHHADERFLPRRPLHRPPRRRLPRRAADEVTIDLRPRYYCPNRNEDGLPLQMRTKPMSTRTTPTPS